MAGTPFKMAGFSGFGNSPLKQEKKVDWSKAPGVNTPERSEFYKKHKLKPDATTTEQYYVSAESGKKVSVGEHGQYGKHPTSSTQIDYDKSGKWGKHWHENLSGQETDKDFVDVGPDSPKPTWSSQTRAGHQNPKIRPQYNKK